MDKNANYSVSQVAIIQAASDAAVANGSKLDLDAAKTLASDPRMNVDDGKGDARGYRSILAKITRMGLPYARKEPVSKDGSPVTKKGDLVARINAIVAGNLDGLDKAPKPALVAIAAYVEAAAEAAFRDAETEDDETVNG